MNFIEIFKSAILGNDSSRKFPQIGICVRCEDTIFDLHTGTNDNKLIKYLNEYHAANKQYPVVLITSLPDRDARKALRETSLSPDIIKNLIDAETMALPMYVEKYIDADPRQDLQAVAGQYYHPDERAMQSLLARPVPVDLHHHGRQFH